MSKIRTAYQDFPRVTVQFSEPSRTKQAFRDECNINGIMARFERTGLVDAVNKIQPQYGDVTGFDFQTALERIAQAQQMFHELPSAVRKRFGNDPAEFVAFVGDAENREEAVRLGLIDEVAPEPPIEVRVVPDASEAPVEPSPAPSAPGSAPG